MYPQHRISAARYEKEAQVMEVLLYTGLNMCFGSSRELSHRDGSFECLLMYMIGFGMWFGSSWEWPHLDGSFEYTLSIHM